jgi:phosphoserine aminotransferase
MIELKVLRISLYNGIILEDTNKLVNFMRIFQTNND